MEIKQKYLNKYMHQIAIDQLVDEYVEKGYTITKDERVGNYVADLVARKDDNVIVIEVKTGKLLSEKKDKIKEIANYIQSRKGFKFLLVIATPPQRKRLKILDLEKLFEESFNSELPDELDALSTHTRVKDVLDIEISELVISDENIFVKGSGVVCVDLQFGSDGDDLRADGYLSEDSFPFYFDVVLRFNDNQLEIDSYNDLKVNTDSY